MLNSGRPTAQVAALILSSPEFLAGLVAFIYAKDLGRTPDGAGLNAWIAALQHGLSIETAQADILGSGEAFAYRS